MVTRKQITVPQFYQAYLNAVKEQALIPALEKNHKRFRKFLKEIPKDKRDYAYEEGKWTIRQLLQHIIDTERVFVFRALWFARKDENPLPGFDEKKWAASLNTKKRKWKVMVSEYMLLRESSIRFFKSLTDEQLHASGIANNSSMSAAALGFVAAGHIEHHINIIKSKYLPISLEQAL